MHGRKNIKRIFIIFWPSLTNPFIFLQHVFHLYYGFRNGLVSLPISKNKECDISDNGSVSPFSGNGMYKIQFWCTG